MDSEPLDQHGARSGRDWPPAFAWAGGRGCLQQCPAAWTNPRSRSVELFQHSVSCRAGGRRALPWRHCRHPRFPPLAAGQGKIQRRGPPAVWLDGRPAALLSALVLHSGSGLAATRNCMSQPGMGGRLGVSPKLAGGVFARGRRW